MDTDHSRCSSKQGQVAQQWLRAIGYDGPVTAHQSGIPGIPLEDTTSGTARFLKGLMHAG